MNSIIEIFMRYKAYNAANLDGGAMAVNGTIINKPQNYDSASNRYLINCWALINE